jgi:beta-glucosidase
MPYYSIPIGLAETEQVGFNFNKKMLTGLLREKLGFNGVIGTDFSVIKGTKVLGFKLLFPKVWGVEKLKPIKRLKKAFEAGVDQIGGETCTKLLVKLVNKGEIQESRIDDSCRRVLRDKFKLGLFDNPYVDEENVKKTCGNKSFVNAGIEAQRKSLILLKNGSINPILPLKEGLKIYIENISKESIAKYGNYVEDINQADIAIIRRSAPSIKQYKYIYEKLFKQGRLDFNKKEKAHLIKIMKTKPTIFDLGLDRPAVLPEINEYCEAFTGHFGCEEDVFLEMIFGKFSPTGKLPYSLPISMEAVNNHNVDEPLKATDVLYPFGYGLTYSKES